MQAHTKLSLSSLVQDHLSSLVRDATCVQRHSKRARFHEILPNNNNNGNNDEHDNIVNHNHNQQQQQQNDNERTRMILRQRLHADDVNLALQWRGSEKLYATGIVMPSGPVSTENDYSNPTTRSVDLNTYLHSENRIPLPSEIGMTCHWLAVDGTQPSIPQNPTTTVVGTTTASASSTTTAAAAASTTNLVRHVLAQQDEFVDMSATTTNDGRRQRPVSIRTLLPRLLSEELQLYFSRVTLAMESDNPVSQQQQQQQRHHHELDVVLSSIATDCGLQELVPFFCRYVATQIYDNIGNVIQLQKLVRFTRCLLVNPHLHLELQLHQLLPPLITCVVAKNLSSSTRSNPYYDNHWALRFESSQVLLMTCDRFGNDYSALKARVLKTLCEATSPDKSLPTIFGGIVSVTMFGPKAVDAFLLPLVIPYYTQWQTQLDNDDDSSPDDGNDDLGKRFELQECQQAIMDALAVFLQRVGRIEQANRINYADLEDAIGADKLVMLQNEPTEYSMCVV